MQDQPFGRQPGRERQAEVAAIPAASMHLEHRVRVLGHRFDGEPADLLECGPPQHGAGAAEEGRVPIVVGVLDEAVEHIALGRHARAGREVPLERVGRIEVVGRLHERIARLRDHPAHGHLQERAGCDVVGVEDGDELTLGLGERVVQVAGLGVQVVAAGDVADAAFGCEITELVPPAVIEQEYTQFFRRPVDRDRAEHGCADDRHRFVVGGDKHVHRWPQGRIVGHRDRLALEWPKGLHVPEHEDEDGVHLGKGQPDAEYQFGCAAEVQCFCDTPEDIAERDREAQHYQEDGDRPAFEPVCDEEDDGRGDGQDGLLPRVELDGRHCDQQQCPDHAADDIEQPAAEAAVRHALPPRTLDSGSLTHGNSSHLRPARRFAAPLLCALLRLRLPGLRHTSGSYQMRRSKTVAGLSHYPCSEHTGPAKTPGSTAA